MASFETQQKQRLINCPVCGSDSVTIVPPPLKRIGKSPENRSSSSREIGLPEVLRTATEYINKNFEDVGNRFAEVALKIHRNELETKNIRGTTTEADEQLLQEEGVSYTKLPALRYDS